MVLKDSLIRRDNLMHHIRSIMMRRCNSLTILSLPRIMEVCKAENLMRRLKKKRLRLDSGALPIAQQFASCRCLDDMQLVGAVKKKTMSRILMFSLPSFWPH